jgi:uncharacterized protein (TIGR04255 family)
MKNAPVYLVVAQVRFNRFNNLDAYAPKIQDQFRIKGYPDFQKLTMNTMNVPFIDQFVVGSNQNPSFETSNRYHFLNIERTDGFLLDQAALTYFTSEYDVFKMLADRFVEGLNIVNDTLPLAYTERFGLRYLDAIFAQEDAPLSKFLTESVLGLSQGNNGNLIHSFSETAFKTGNINVITRTVIQNGPLGLPIDLQPPVVQIAERFLSRNGPHAILDTDASIDGRAAFAADKVDKHLATLHDECVRMFQLTTTDYARDSWK